MNSNQAKIVISRFGGAVPMSRITGWPIHRIYNAQRIGYFQHKDRQPLLDIAAANDVPLTPQDFVADLTAPAPAAAQQ